MSFSISRCKENELSLVQLQNNATKTTVSILPAYGALLHGFEIEGKDQRHNFIDHYAGLQELQQHLNISYKSSKLSPFVCRIADGQYEYEGKTYSFANKFMDGTAIHGLLFDKPFNTVNEFADDHQATISLRHHYKKTDPGYPFEYICEVRYSLLPDNILQVATTILNLDDQPIPVADGWHPYFSLGGNIDDQVLHFKAESMLEFSSRLLPTGKTIPYTEFNEPAFLGDTQLDNCFMIRSMEGVPCVTLHNPANQLTLAIYTNTYYPFLQLYTPDHRQSIAIENLSGAPDCFNNKMGLQVIPPRQSFTGTVWYQAVYNPSEAQGH